jgi:hypothetical protein
VAAKDGPDLMRLPRPTLAEPYTLPEPSELASEDTDVLSLLTTTVALFGLGLYSVLSLIGLVTG